MGIQHSASGVVASVAGHPGNVAHQMQSLEALQSMVNESRSEWQRKHQEVGLYGTWLHDNSLSHNVDVALQTCGLSLEPAKIVAMNYYQPTWTTSNKAN
jgi:hypothetical protein